MAYDIEGIVNPAEIVTLKSLNTEINESTTALIKFLELQAKYKTSVDNVAGSNSSATQKISEYTKIINKAADEQNKLTVLAKEHEKIQQQLVATEAKISASKSESNKKLIENRLEIQKQNQAIKDNIKANDASDGSLVRMRLKLKELTEAYDKSGTRTKAAAKEIDTLSREIGKAESATNRHQRGVGGYADQLGKLPGFLGRAASGAAGLGKQLWALVANPIVAIVAGIVLAFTALVKIFKSTDEGANFLDAIFKSLGAILDVLKRRVLLLIDGFKALFSGNFKEAGEKFKGTVSGIGKEIASTTKEAWELTYALDALEDSMRANISKVADYENKIARLRVIAKDQTKTDKERMEAAKQALDMQRELADDEVKFKEQQYDIDLRDAARKIQVKKETIDTFIALDAKQRDEQIKNNKDYQLIENQLGDEGVKKLEDSYVAKVNADTEYFTGIRRQQSEYTGFVKELQDERTRIATEAAEKAKEIEEKRIEDEKKANEEIEKERLKNLAIQTKQLEAFIEYQKGKKAEQDNIDKLLIESAIRDRQRQYEAEKMLIESTAGNETEARRRIFDLNKKYIAEDIAETEKQLLAAKDNTEEYIKLEDELKDLKHENNILEGEENKKLHEEKLARQKELVDGLTQLGSKIFEFTIANTNAELSALEEKNKKGIISEQEFNKKKAELELKKAKQERNKALFEIAINTASAVVEALPNVALAVIAGVIGALSAATVLAEPLPKYYTGTKNAKEVGIVGDRGRELATLTTGENIMFDKPTLYAGKKFKGMHVRTNAETERIMSSTERTGFNPVSFSDSKLLEKLDRVEKAITSKPVGIFQNGNLIGTQSPTHREIYVNRLKYGK